MRSRAIPAHLKRYIAVRLATVEKRLLTKIYGERAAREKGDAASDEQDQLLADQIGRLGNEQTRWTHRVRWLERTLKQAPHVALRRRKR